MELRKFFHEVYCSARPQSADSATTYLAAIARLEGYTGKSVDTNDLDEQAVAAFLNAYRKEFSASSANNKRKHIECLWRFAADCGLASHPNEHALPKFKQPKRQPKAWTPEEYGLLLRSCYRMRKIEKNGIVWTGQHWRCFLLVQYDSAHRRGCLLSFPNENPPRIATLRSQLVGDELTVLAEHTKHNADTTHRLHADTVREINGLPESPYLFPWPYNERSFDAEYKLLLAYAGMDVGRRNGTHKNRRTSATQVAKKRGIAAASRHCRHSSEAQTVRAYIDATQLPTESAADIIDRPA